MNARSDTEGKTDIEPEAYGRGTVELLESALDSGTDRVCLLMRHSAREFAPGVHDLVNPLTDEGREFSQRLGRWLPKSVHVRGYASPPERCVETAELAVQAHAEHDGETTEVRVVESLGPFYALDQVKMWKGMQIAGGLGNYVREWVGGNVATDAMIAADVASAMVVGASLHRLRTAKSPDHVDLCVSHDITLMVVRDQFLNEAAGEVEVPFLDGLVLFEADGGVWLQSRHGQPVNIADKLSGYGY